MNQPLPSVDSAVAEPAGPVAMGETPNPPATQPAAWWRRALPFAVSLALVAFTVSRVDLRAFVRHVAAVNTPAFLSFAVAFVVGLLTADALATAIVYRRTVAPVSFREFWILRGASYLPSILNHHVGQAILTYYVSRRYGVSLARMAGGTLLVYVSWSGLLVGAGVLAMIVNGEPLFPMPVAVLGAGVAYLAVIALRPARLASIKFLAPLFEAGLVGHLIALVVRVPHFVVLFLGTWLPFAFFGVRIPLQAALIYVPIVMVAVTLPLTPQGVGTRALLAVTFFSRYAPGATPEEHAAAIAAATTSFEVAFTLAEAALGLLLLKRAMPTLDARPPRPRRALTSAAVRPGGRPPRPLSSPPRTQALDQARIPAKSAGMRRALPPGRSAARCARTGEPVMSEMFHNGGFGMYPTTIFGLMLIAATIRYAMSPERRFVPLQVALGMVTLASGGLGFVTGLIKSTMAVGVAPDQRWLWVIGMGESLNNVALALALVLVGTLAASVGALRLAQVDPTGARLAG